MGKRKYNFWFPQSAPRKLFLSIALCVSAGAIAPFVAAFWYIHPAYDDQWFWYRSSLDGLFRTQVAWYQNHSGRFAANFIVGAIASGIRINLLFRLACLGIFVALFAALWRLLLIVFRGSRTESAALAGLLFSAYLTVMPSPAQGFYWLAGGVTYTLGTAIALYAIGGVLDQRDAPEKLPWWCLIVFVSAGMNEINLFLVNAFLISWFVSRWKARRAIRAFLPLIAASVAGTLGAVLAPGNWNRLRVSSVEASNAGNIGWALTAGVREFATDFYAVLLFSPAIVFALACVLLADGSPDTADDRRSPFASSVNFLGVSAVCIYAIIVFYGYTQGIRTIPRVLNVVYLLIFLISMWTATSMSGRNRAATTAFGSVGVVLLLLAFCIPIVRPGSKVRTAYSEWISNEWGEYDRELSLREEYLEQHSNSDVTVHSVKSRPSTLFVYDVSADANYRYNQYYARFYGVRSLRADP
jgi:hypothetical protein